jgi:DNA-binding NtrC family response regulator
MRSRKSRGTPAGWLWIAEGAGAVRIAAECIHKITPLRGKDVMPHALAKYRILAVDDDPNIREVIHGALIPDGFTPVIVENARQACEQIEMRRFDLLLSDLYLPEEDGTTIIRCFKKKYPQKEIIVITGYPEENHLRIMHELGVNEYLTKPFTLHQLRFSVISALQKVDMCSRHDARVHQSHSDSHNKMGLIGTSPYIKGLREKVLTVAKSDIPVMINGPSGTGKEVIANAVHNFSDRKERKMITVNCAAIPTHLEESEFFGHVKGSFTGATTNKAGIMESADGSTVFLDEVGELSPPVQAKLLRVLDNGQYTRVGEHRARHTDIRIVSATNRNISEMITNGAFRTDLFYRLNGMHLQTKPLHTHRDDIPYLVSHFLSRLAPDTFLTDEALSLLCSYQWPGNVRELKHILHQLAVYADTTGQINRISVEQVLKPQFCEESVSRTPTYTAAKTMFERDYFNAILARHHGNVSKVSREVGLHRPNLLRKLKELNISPQEYRD